METFEKKVERYMQCDKRTLAEMLALKDLVDENRQYIYYRPIDTVEPTIIPLGGDWTITCAV